MCSQMWLFYSYFYNSKQNWNIETNRSCVSPATRLSWILERSFWGYSWTHGILPLIPSMDPRLQLPLGNDWTSRQKLKSPNHTSFGFCKTAEFKQGFFPAVLWFVSMGGNLQDHRVRISHRQGSKAMLQSNHWVLGLKPAVIVYSGGLCLCILAVWVGLKPPINSEQYLQLCPRMTLLEIRCIFTLQGWQVRIDVPLCHRTATSTVAAGNPGRAGMRKESLSIAVFQVSCRGLSSPALKPPIIPSSLSCRAALVLKHKNQSDAHSSLLASFSLLKTTLKNEKTSTSSFCSSGEETDDT